MPYWKDDDDYYSNQGKTSLCVRHAVAKALIFDWRMNFGGKHPIDLWSIISFLVAAGVQKGSSSAKVLEYHSLKGQIMGPDGNVYEMKIKVWRRPKQ